MRVIDENGDLVGILSKSDALAEAQKRGVDLVEVSPKATPVLCKLIDYGKYLYSLQKKEKHVKKSAQKHELKGLRLTFRMDIGDLQRQQKKAQSFLESGHSIKFQMMLRGREKAHQSLAVEKMHEFLEFFGEMIQIDQEPKFAGFQVITIIKPATGKKSSAKKSEKTLAPNQKISTNTSEKENHSPEK